VPAGGRSVWVSSLWRMTTINTVILLGVDRGDRESVFEEERVGHDEGCDRWLFGLSFNSPINLSTSYSNSSLHQSWTTNQPLHAFVPTLAFFLFLT
jgi:hypothetical protein